MIRSKPLRFRFALLLTSLFVVGAAHAGTEKGVDEEYDRLIESNPADREKIEEAGALLGDDEYGGEVVAWQETLSADPELATNESLFTEALEKDEALQKRLDELEEALASEPGAVAEMAAYDSLLAADPELAARMEEVERAAGEDDTFVDEYGAQAAWLEENPEEAEAFYADENGPTWAGDSHQMALYVNYLVARPALYRAHWRLYRHLHSHPPVARRVYRHWKWLAPRPALRFAIRRYHHRAAKISRVHKLFWRRNLALARRPWLRNHKWRYRVALGKNPALRKHARYLSRHPAVARGVVRHHRWEKKHHPHGKAQKAHTPGKAAGAQKKKVRATKKKKAGH